MKQNIIAFLGWMCAVTVMSAGIVHAESITITAEKGFVTAKGIDEKPDAKGFVLVREVVLPPFEAGAYYRPFSGGVATGNRVEAVAFNSLSELQDYQPPTTRKGHANIQQGQFILLKVNNEKYLALLPMISLDAYTQFFMQQGKLVVKAGSLGVDRIKGDLPLLIWAHGKSPYEATRSAWKMAIDSGHIAADWRSSKPYPEMYGYLGWCSWEHYKRDISEDVIKGAVKTLETCGAPIRWIVVDDGYLTQEGRKLICFAPNKIKFPGGWAPVTALKSDDKIKWMGLWRNMLGYMEGISTKHTMDDMADHLVPGVAKGRTLVKGKYMLPSGSPEAAKAFFDMMILDSKESGFDFTKVDFQTKAFFLYAGQGNAVRAMRNNNEALEEACKKHQIPLLNCIAQPNVNSLQTRYSALTRSSPDYNQADKNKNKCNTYQSFANHLWMGQTVWGDLDMFHSHDERDAETMALARAISGGPVYISDEPSKVVPEVLTPFCYQDGKLLRTAAPATLLPESFFIHPFRDENVFRVIAPLEDKVAAIALFNFTEGGKTLGSGFTTTDYCHAGELLQPAETWEQPEEGLLVYDREKKTVAPLNDGYMTDIADFGGKLFLLYPNTKGWAVIGRTDKYLPSAAVKIKSVSDVEVVFTLEESGPLMVWSERGTPKMEGVAFKLVGNNLYLAELPLGEGSQEIILKR